MRLNFCAHCGHKLDHRIPPGDDRPRFICRECGAVQYENPKLVVGCIPEWEDKILLCRRNIDPCRGLWTLPAGYLENGETVMDGAVREVREETAATVTGLSPFALFDLPFIGQVYLMFRSQLVKPDFQPTRESSQVRLFAEAQIPWDEMAFKVITKTLKHYFEDRSRGRFEFHTGEIQRQPPASPAE